MQQLPGRLWEAKKDASHHRQQPRARLAPTRPRWSARSATSRRARRPFAARIVELDKRIRGLVPRVAALSREQQGQVQELAVAELERQKERLATYATQARYAVAQLYDRANLAKKDDDATKQ